MFAVGIFVGITHKPLLNILLPRFFHSSFQDIIPFTPNEKVESLIQLIVEFSFGHRDMTNIIILIIFACSLNESSIGILNGAVVILSNFDRAGFNRLVGQS